MSYENINSIENTTCNVRVFSVNFKKTRYVCFYANKSSSINLIWI